MRKLFSEKLNILGNDYKTRYSYHVKLTSFKKYFQGLWFSETDLKKPLYTKENFNKFTGRKKRGNQWEQLSSLFDNSLNYDWKKQCDWENSVIGSGKNQFDISFGYEVHIEIPFQKLKELDQKQSFFNQGYYIGGPVLNIALAKQFKISSRWCAFYLVV